MDINEQFREAVRIGSLIDVKNLIKQGADINDLPSSCYTALILAIEKENLEMVKYLVENGADVNNEDHKSPLASAKKNKCRDIEEYLKEKTDINVQLRFAGKTDNLLELEILISKGADIKSKDANGFTILELAATYGNLNVVKYLVEHGVDINAEDADAGILIYASQDGNLDMVKYLSDNGADINAMASNGWTALMQAADSGHLDIVTYLVENGADVDIKDADDYVAWMVAELQGYTEIVDYLKSKGAK